MSKWFSVAFGVLLVGVMSAPAWAQTAPPPKPSVDPSPSEPARNISLGYAFMHDSSWDENLFYGYVVTFSQRIKPNLAIIGEAGGSHGEYRDTGFSIQRYAFLGGVKLSGGEGQLRPFFHVMGGYSRQGGDVGIAHGIALQPGGGVDFALTEKITLRGQGDFRFTFENSEHYTSYRLSGGLVIYLGKKNQ